jgi:hypothetical protein
LRPSLELVSGLLENWIEEAGYRARGLKKQVVRPVSNSLQVREFAGKVIFLREPNYSYNALRIPIQPFAEALKSKWGRRRTVEKRRGTLPGVGQTCEE